MMISIVNFSFKKGIKIIAILFRSIGSGSGSEDSESSENPMQTIPILVSFNASNGPKTTLVTISGNNFRINTTQVFFNA